MDQIEQEYLDNLQDLLEQAKIAGICAKEFHKIVDESLKNIERDRSDKYLNFHLKKKYILLFLLFLLYTINYALHEKPLSLFLCKIQEFIYPGLKLLRIMSIPVISLFPSLTELYDETCLIQNPFFRVAGMDCWPCSEVKGILETTQIDPHFQPHTSPPFILKTDQKIKTIDDLKTKYLENKKIFDDNAPKLTVNEKDIIFAQDFFNNYDISKSNTYKWRINRMLPALIMRTVFPKPNIIPRLGQSTERFIMIDDPNSMFYPFPEPECNYVFIIQSKGERLVEFQPAEECLHKCEPVSVLLKQSYMLWYNWWYWRPVSHSTTSNSTSISYMGSYC